MPTFRRALAGLTSSLLCAVGLAVVFAPAAHAAAADIQITEIAYGGNASYTGDSGDGEYVEMTNVGDAAQDMTGWAFNVLKGTTNVGNIDLSGFGTVQPGESVIVTDLTPADFRAEWNLKPSVKVVSDKQGVATAVTLDGGPDTVSIYNNGHALVDQVGYGAKATTCNVPGNGCFTGKGVAAEVQAGGTASTTIASGWTNPATVGDAEGAWTSANGAVGSPGASTLGTSTPDDVQAGRIAIAGATDQNVTVNAPFSYTGLTANGGTGTYTWSVTGLDGSALSIDATTGEISGTPTTEGTFNVTVTATDTADATTSTSFTITVLGARDPNWQDIVINEITADNEPNPELTTNLPAALLTALDSADNPRGAARDLVEIYNKGSQAVDINGWKQIDSHAVSNAQVFSDGVFDADGNKITSVPAHGYGVFQSVQGLGSGGDAVQILLPDGTLVDSVTYGPSQAGYDEGLDPNAEGPNSTTEPYQTLARCPDGAGEVNTTSDSAGTTWYSVAPGSFGTSNDAACDSGNAVRYFNEQPPTGLPSTCMPSMPADSDSVAVPGAVAWPTSDIATPVDNVCEFITPQDPTGNDISGLVFSADGSVLWAAQNKNHLWKLVKDPASGTYQPATDNDWGSGKGITFTGTDPNASQPDSEAITIGGNGDVFTTSERDNQASNTSKDEVLEYNPNDAGTTLAPVKQWDLTSEFVPSIIAATGDDANLGFEGVTYVPDSFLTAQGFHDQNLNKVYDPADYPAHGHGLFFVAMEKNGHIYAYSLNDDGSFQRVADIDTGIHGQSAIADVQYNADDQGIWAHCDNDCSVADSLLKIDDNGDFTRVASYQRPQGLPDDNIEGFAIAPASTAVDGKREVLWSDDGIWGSGNAWNADHTGNAPSIGWGHALYTGTIPVSAAPSALTGTVTPTGTVGTTYASPALTPTGGFPAVFSYSISHGSLPAGLTLDARTGAITGTPTKPGTSKFTISTSNGIGAPATMATRIKVKNKPKIK